MKPKQIWANLGVKDVAATVNFYTSLGFRLNGQYQSTELACILFGEHNFAINFFLAEKLRSNLNVDLADPAMASEIIFSLSAETKEEVAEWEQKVADAGGKVLKPAGEDHEGFYYCVFADPDGHKFNVLYMREGM